MSERGRGAAGGVRRAVLTAAIASLTVLASSCGAARGGSAGGTEEAAVMVHVDNRSWSTMHLYVLSDGQWNSLGQLSSQATADYQIPRSMLAGARLIRLAADPVGSVQAYLSDEIHVLPGDVVEWKLADQPQFSSLSVH